MTTTIRTTAMPAPDKYQELIRHLPVGVYRNTPGSRGHFLEANPAILSMFEADSKKEFLKHNVSDFYADPGKRKLVATKIMKHGFIRGEQLELITLKGKKFTGSVTAALTKDQNGEICFDGIIEDITTQKKAGALARKKEMQDQLEQTLDSMADGCQIISPDFRYIYVNKLVASQGHKPRSELLGRTMVEVYPGIEKTKMFACLKRCMKNQRLYKMENEFQFPGGGTGWFELKMEPVPEGVLIFSADITKRKRYEDASKVHDKQLEDLNRTQDDTRRALLNVMEDLKKANDEIELEKITDMAILENIGEGFIAIDTKGEIIMMNKAAEALIEQKETVLKGKKITTLRMLDAEDRAIASADRPISLALKSGKTIGPSFAEYYYVRPDKQKFPLGIIVTPIKLDGKIIGAIEVFRDVSKEQEIDKAKTEFVSIASHQLRTPLGIARWYLEAIEDEGYLNVLPPTGQDYLREVRKSNERVLKVVRELLSVSRIDQGRVKDNSQPTDVAELVQSVVKELNPLAVKKQVSLSLRLDKPRPPALRIDPLRLHEVIQNLVSNALNYTLPEGAVTVTVAKQANGVMISVKDTGIGISKEDRPKLFTKFFRSEQATSNNTDGSGLGLYVVKSYVEDWGGRVSLESQEGHGSTFTISLPLKNPKKKVK